MWHVECLQSLWYATYLNQNNIYLWKMIVTTATSWRRCLGAEVLGVSILDRALFQGFISKSVILRIKLNKIQHIIRTVRIIYCC